MNPDCWGCRATPARFCGTCVQQAIDERHALERAAHAEKAKLEYYLDALEGLQDQDVKIAALKESLARHAPKLTDKYTSMEPEPRQEAHFDLIAAALISARVNASRIIGAAMDARMAMIATTISNSKSEKPFCMPRISTPGGPDPGRSSRIEGKDGSGAGAGQIARGPLSGRPDRGSLTARGAIGPPGKG